VSWSPNRSISPTSAPFASDEPVVLPDDRAGRQGLTQVGDTGQLAARLDLLGLKFPPGLAIGVAFARKRRMGEGGEIGCGGKI
jgi:hypothetical protein